MKKKKRERKRKIYVTEFEFFLLIFSHSWILLTKIKALQIRTRQIKQELMRKKSIMNKERHKQIVRRFDGLFCECKKEQSN